MISSFKWHDSKQKYKDKTYVFSSVSHCDDLQLINNNHDPKRNKLMAKNHDTKLNKTNQKGPSMN